MGKSTDYSVDSERRYYDGAAEDRRVLPYEQLDQYLRGSVGLDAFRGKRVLDIGAGEGVYSAWIADCGGAAEVLGIELIEHRIRRDYERALPNLRFASGNVFELQLAERYDVVFMNLVLHHLRFRLAEALAIVRRALVPGGEFIAFEPNPYAPASALAHWLHERSANEGFLTSRRTAKALEAEGFGNIRFGYFWRDRRWARHPLLASSFWIRATRQAA